MKTWRMLSSGIFLNLITLAVSIIIICHHQDDNYHDHDQDNQDIHDQYPHHLNLHRFRILKETKPHTPNGQTDVHCPMDE